MRIAVASGKGGTGKTTVAVNLARTAAALGEQVHLCDCDVEEPNAHLYLEPSINEAHIVEMLVPVVDRHRCTHCGLCAEFCEFNAITCLPDRTIIADDLCHNCGGCALVCPEGALQDVGFPLGEVETGMSRRIGYSGAHCEIGSTRIPPLIAAVKATAPREGWVILDAPPGTACPVTETVQDADFVVLVTEPTPFGLHDLAAILQLLRLLDRPCGVVINRDTGNSLLIDEFCDREGVRILARIPFRRSVAEASARGKFAIDIDRTAAAALTTLCYALQTLEEVGA